MPGDNDPVDPDKMTPKELYDHFTKLIVGQAQDNDTRYAELGDKIDGIETSFANQLEARFREVLARLPPVAPAAPPRTNPNVRGRARRVPLPTDGVAGAAAFADDYEGDDDFLDEQEEACEVLQQQPGRPRALNPNARAPPLVRDDDHVAKLKLHVPPFNGSYNPDAYLTWELEVEQRFACLNYPEDRRVVAATCEFTDFASIWWAE